MSPGEMRSGRATYGHRRRAELILEPIPPCVCGDDPCAQNCPTREDDRRNDTEETT